jgi:hypothetical protein
MRHQARGVFFARFVLGTRVVTFLAAGTFGVSAMRFASAEGAGSPIFLPEAISRSLLPRGRQPHDVSSRGCLAQERGKFGERSHGRPQEILDTPLLRGDELCQ